MPDFAPDQEFNVGDTQDIWAALTRGQRSEQPQTDDLAAFRSGVPQTPAAPRQDSSSVSGELLDRVRDAVLRRETTAQSSATARPATAPQPAAPQTLRQPETFPRQPAAFPQPGQPVDDQQGLSRRRRREAEVADQREDGLPNDLFDPRRAAAPQPVQPTGFEGYDYEDDGYYDEPYLPEPTVAIPRQATELDAPSHTTNPISLPQAFSEPAGDDAITFSSPVPVAPAEHRDPWGAAQVDPAFIEPEHRWEDEDDDELQGYQPRSYTPGPIPAPPAHPFVEPQSPPRSRQRRSRTPSSGRRARSPTSPASRR